MLLTKDVSYEYSSSFQLEGLDIEIKKGEIVSLIGPNGSGKSTLLRIISRLIRPKGGEVILDGTSIQRMNSIDIAKKLAMLPQMHDHQLDLTVSELVEFGRYPHQRKYNKLTSEDKKIIEWAINVTRLSKYRNRMLQSLSGGERQRAWIAMAIAQRPNILLLDEPTTYLDISHQLEVMELIHSLNISLGMTVVMVLHDINQAARYSDRLIVIKDGSVYFDGRPQQVLCKEMFQTIFEIDAEIDSKEGKPFFTPIRSRKEGNR